MAMPGRKFSASGEYRYGFNGKENDKDISEGGQDYGMRIYDVRLGKFLSVDPLFQDYPELTTYQFASNTPIWCIDFDGEEGLIATGMPMGNSGYGHGMIGSPEMGAKTSPEIISLICDFTPGVGTVKGIIEAFRGKDLVTGEKLSGGERLLGIVPYLGKARKVKNIIKVAKAAEKVNEVKDVAKVVLKKEARIFKTAKNTDKINKLARVAEHNQDAKKVMLGKYIANSADSYEKRAGDAYTYFQIDNWDNVAASMGKSGNKMLDVNKKFLDNQIEAGKEFFFSSNPKEATGYLKDEINYLMEKGFKSFIEVGKNKKLWKAVK